MDNELNLTNEIMDSINNTINSNIQELKQSIIEKNQNNNESLNSIKAELIKLKEKKGTEIREFNNIKNQLKEKINEENQFKDELDNELYKVKKSKKHLKTTKLPPIIKNNFNLPKIPNIFRQNNENQKITIHSETNNHLPFKSKDIKINFNSKFNPTDYFNDYKLEELFNKNNKYPQFYNKNKIAIEVKSSYFDIKDDYYNNQDLAENDYLEEDIWVLRNNKRRLNKIYKKEKDLIINDFDKKEKLKIDYDEIEEILNNFL